MSQQLQQLLKQELTVPEILREYGRRFTQISTQYSDGHNGRCAMGVIMSYYGWNGKDDSQASGKLLGANSKYSTSFLYCSLLKLKVIILTIYMINPFTIIM